MNELDRPRRRRGCEERSEKGVVSFPFVSRAIPALSSQCHLSYIILCSSLAAANLSRLIMFFLYGKGFAVWVSSRKEISQRIYCKQASLCVSSMTSFSREFLCCNVNFRAFLVFYFLRTSRFYLVSIAQRLFCLNKAVHPISYMQDLWHVSSYGLTCQGNCIDNWTFSSKFCILFLYKILEIRILP